ncbi:MAG: TIR domain-containing protein [Candidatus Heimdallarchaeota archaeon]
MRKRYRVFVSYHHENDEDYKKRFEEKGGSIVVSNQIQTEDIDSHSEMEAIIAKIRTKYLRDSTVTIVLVGKETWKQKQIDWEIAASIQKIQKIPRSGLMGLILPTHPNFSGKKVEPSLIPPRLYDNITNRYARIYHWTEKLSSIQSWIHAAVRRKERKEPDNSRPLFRKNYFGSRWE